jgi:hypothetical protein
MLSVAVIAFVLSLPTPPMPKLGLPRGEDPRDVSPIPTPVVPPLVLPKERRP